MGPKQRLKCCYVPGCTTGYARTENGEKLSLFKAPADLERRRQWERNLHRADKPLTEDCAVCELHFEPRYVIRDYVHIVDGAEVRIPRGRPMLDPEAIPTLLPNLPQYLSKRVPPERRRQKNKRDQSAGPRKKQRLTNIDEQVVGDEPSNSNDTHALLSVADLKQLKPPNNYWTLHELRDDEGVCFTSCSLNSVTGEVNVEKAVFFTVDSASGATSRTFVLGKLVAHAAVPTMNTATEILLQAHEMHICKGAAASDEDYLLSNLTEHLERQINKNHKLCIAPGAMADQQRKECPASTAST